MANMLGCPSLCPSDHCPKCPTCGEAVTVSVPDERSGVTVTSCAECGYEDIG